jgi:hypothetical protein
MSVVMNNKIAVLVASIALSMFAAACSRPASNTTNANQSNINVSESPPQESPKMKEINHNTLRYSGPQGEKVIVKVQAQGTTHLVEYTLEGNTQKLVQGNDIIFTLVKKPNNEPMNLQLVLDYAPNGTYVVAVMNVTNCVKDTTQQNTCVHQWSGPNTQIKDFKFFAD